MSCNNKFILQKLHCAVNGFVEVVEDQFCCQLMQEMHVCSCRQQETSANSTCVPLRTTKVSTTEMHVLSILAIPPSLLPLKNHENESESFKYNSIYIYCCLFCMQWHLQVAQRTCSRALGIISCYVFGLFVFHCFQFNRNIRQPNDY